DATVPIAFKKTEHFEKDYYHDPLVEVKSEFVDHYFWMRFTGGADAKAREKNFRIDLPNAVPRDKISRRGELRIKFQGISTRANANHRAWVRLSGKSLVPAVQWRKQGAPLLIRQFDQNAVLHHDSPNFLNILAGDNNNTPVSRADFYLDWAELDYWHSFRAQDGKLEFNSDTEPPTVGGTTRFQIDGFSRKEINLYRIRKGSLVAKLQNMWIDEFEEGNYRVTFEDRVDQPTTYFAADDISYSYINTPVLAKTADLKNPTNQADYIVISHTNFFDSIQPLVEYRESQGMKVKIVDIDIIYDQFSHGLFNPNAIQKFLRYAYVNWRKPAPTFVLLVGDAHYDYKGSIVQVYRKDYDKKYNLYPIFV
ncbi:MAG: C25 family cysteine peptidase, partial [Candidatus Poribacteria bacterium]|nr:C25 family cysteine peptidase [Candidatus Poribacteria bacterium]